MDKYQGQRMPPYLRVPLYMLENKEYIEWLGTTESKVWHAMYRHIVRAPMKGKQGKVYRRYYNDGKLAMHHSLDEIARMVGIKSKGHISEYIKSMVKKGYIIKHEDSWRYRKMIVYEFGTHDNGVNKHETLHLHRKMIEDYGGKRLDEHKL